MRDPYGPARVVHTLVEHWARQTPDAVAVSVSGEEAQLTYRELNARANRLARTLRAAGIGVESRVAVTVDRSLRLPVALLAILKAGGAYVPLDPAYPQERRAFMLDDTQAAVVVRLGDLPDDFAASRTVVAVDDVTPEGPDAEDPGVAVVPANLAYIVYTSGSTGVPKGVAVDHGSVVDLVRDDPRLHVAPGDMVAQFAPIAFDASTFELWGALGRGGRLVILPSDQLSIEELGRELRRTRPAWFFLTSGLFHLLVDHDLDALRSVGTLISGGDVMSPHHVRRAAGAGTTVYAAYGPTETTTFASLHLVDPGSELERTPIGRPLAGMAMRVLGPDGREVPDGEPGELHIAGAGLARGYHDRPGLTAERFVPDPAAPEPGARLYRTGDLARRLPGGELEFLGRADRQVKVRGFRVELGEIEAVLVTHLSIAAAAVAALEGEGGMKRLVAYVAPAPGEEIVASELRAWLTDKLPAYMRPATFKVLDELPLDANGKIDRRALPYPWGHRDDPDLPPYEPPRTELERILATVWADALGLDRVGVWDDYFELGGDSLGSVAMLARLDELGISLRARDLFQQHSIAAISELAEERKPAPVREPAG